MSDEKTLNTSMTLPTAWKLYGINLGIMVIIYLLGSKIALFSGLLEPAIFFGYLICGFWLNRNVLRKLIDWHPVNATIADQHRTKIYFFFLWPFKYPILFYHLAVIKHL